MQAAAAAARSTPDLVALGLHAAAL